MEYQAVASRVMCRCWDQSPHCLPHPTLESRSGVSCYVKASFLGWDKCFSLGSGGSGIILTLEGSGPAWSTYTSNIPYVPLLHQPLLPPPATCRTAPWLTFTEYFWLSVQRFPWDIGDNFCKHSLEFWGSLHPMGLTLTKGNESEWVRAPASILLVESLEVHSVGLSRVLAGLNSAHMNGKISSRVFPSLFCSLHLPFHFLEITFQYHYLCVDPYSRLCFPRGSRTQHSCTPLRKGYLPSLGAELLLWLGGHEAF